MIMDPRVSKSELCHRLCVCFAAVVAAGTAFVSGATVLCTPDVVVETMETGAKVKSVRYKGMCFSFGEPFSFGDRFSRNVGPRTCEFQPVGDAPWRLEREWREKDAAGTETPCVRYSIIPRAFDGFRVTKTYRLRVAPNPELEVVWCATNMTDETLPFGFCTVVAMLAGDGVNEVRFPRKDGMTAWTYPGNETPLEVSEGPAQRWCAFWDKATGRGAVIRWPRGELTGMTSWISQSGGRCQTLEFFGVNRSVPKGGAVTAKATVSFLGDAPAAVAGLDEPVGPLVAEPFTCWLRKYTDKAYARSIREVKRPRPSGRMSEADAAKVLREELHIPLDFLGAVHTNTVTAHVPWFKPSDSCDILYLHDPDWSFVGSGIRLVPEILQRGEFACCTLPLLRQVNGIAGSQPYSVWQTSFGSVLDDWTLACLRNVTKLPQVAIFHKFDFAFAQPVALEIFRSWQAKGVSFAIVDCRNVPQEFRARYESAPSGPVKVIPKFTKHDELAYFYRGETGTLNAVLRLGQNSNPACPEEFRAERGPVDSGRDFPHREYAQLALVKALRRLAGAATPVRVLSADGDKVVLESAAAGDVTIERRVFDLHRYEEAMLTETVSLKKGRNALALRRPDLPGGEHVVHLRVLMSDGQVSDAAAWRLPTPDSFAPVLAFSHANRIYEAAERVAFAVTATNTLPVDAVFAAEIEGCNYRVMRRGESRDGRFSFDLPIRPDRIYRVNVALRAGGRTLSKAFGEFAVRAPAPDPTDTSAYITIYPTHEPEVPALLEELGFDLVIGGSHSVVRDMANRNMQCVPRGCAADYEKWFRPYRDDNPLGNPVRTPCFSSPEFAAMLADRIDRWADDAEYDYYNVRQHWLGDECYLGSSVCFSPHCLKAFRAELAVRYVDVARLNSAWGTSFESFDEVIPNTLKDIKDKKRLGSWLEHKMFMSRTFARRWVGDSQKILERKAPGSYCGPTGTPPPGYGYDWAEMMRYIGCIGYYFGAQRKYIHDFAELYGRTVIAGQCGGGYTHADVDYEPYNYDTMWSGLLKGSNLAYHYWGASIYGDGSPTSNMVYWAKSMQELKGGIGKLVLSAKPARGLYVLYSQPSLYAANATGVGRDWQNAQTSWWRLLSDLGYEFLFYPYGMLAEQGFPEDARALVLPYALALSDREVLAIREFIRRGGVVLADVAPGAYDETGLARVPAPLADIPLIGSEIASYSAVTGGGIGGETSSETSGGDELKERLGDSVVPVLTRAGLRPNARIVGRNGRAVACETTLRRDGSNFVFAMHVDTKGADNNGTHKGVNTAIGRFDFRKGTPITATLPVKGHVYDVRARTYLGFTDTVATSLIPGWTRLYTILKDRPGKITIEGPTTLCTGEKAIFRYAAEGATGPQVYHVRLIDPSGRDNRNFRRNIHTDGTGEYVFESAFNDPVGTWTLVVKHVNTGLEGRCAFTVKPVSSSLISCRSFNTVTH